MSVSIVFLLAIVAGLAYLVYLQSNDISELRARIAKASREADDVEDALAGRKRSR